MRSKTETDLETIRSRLARWLKFPYGELTGQLHYAGIAPRILAEELLFQKEDPSATLIDYKFYCFGGEPKYCLAISDRRLEDNNDHAKMMYDLGWRRLDSCFAPGTQLAPVKMPSQLNEMLEISTKLSEGISFVRVDLYEVNDEVKFSEMTFLPGLNAGFTESFQRELGDLIKIPESGVGE